MTKNEEAPSESWADDLEEGLIVRLDEGENIVAFLDNRALREPHPYGADPEQLQWVFAAAINGEAGKFYTRSKRLLAQLKPHMPLKAKQFSIERTGKGIKTRYLVKPMGSLKDDDPTMQLQLPGAFE